MHEQTITNSISLGTFVAGNATSLEVAQYAHLDNRSNTKSPATPAMPARDLRAIAYKETAVHTLFFDHTTPEWFVDARCADGAGTFASLFFSEDLSEIARAKAICGNCPVRDNCLEGAVDRREPWGVWGGELLMNGKVLSAERRRRGRPPKVARAESAIDELGYVISA